LICKQLSKHWKKSRAELFISYLAKKYQDDPVIFFQHALGLFTWSKMIEILNSVRDNKKTAVFACHGSSKTFTAAGVAVWFLNMFSKSRVITTAPTNPQVELLLWAEINRIYRESRIKLIGECQTMFIRTPESEHYAHGFSTDKASRAEGFHAPQILFIVDEAKGVKQWFWDAAEGAMVGGMSRILALSTTDGIQPGEKFHSIFTDPKVRKNWNVIQIDDHDLPSFTGEQMQGRDFSTGEIIWKSIVELGAQLSTPEWDMERQDEWGKDSVLYLTKCRGQVVDQTEASIVTLSQAIKMIENSQNENFNTDGAIEIGVDVARFGDDTSQFYKRKGMKIIEGKTFAKIDTQMLSDELEKFMDFKKFPNEVVAKIDDTGIGGAVTDAMKRRGYKNIVPINFQQVANNPDKYPNAISEMWFETAKLIPQISCPADDELKAQLVNRKKMPMDSKGRQVVEPKSEYKRRMGGHSPDKADSFLLTFYNCSRYINNMAAKMLDYDVMEI